MKIIINKNEIELKEADFDKLLIEYLRDDLGLTGTKNGCGIGSCGTCTVLVDDKPVLACKKKISEFAGKSILTIEGLAPLGEALHPLQQAFIDAGAIQCGFCTPAMVLRAHALLLKNSNPSRPDIRKALQPVLCRCTGYQQIVDAVELAKSEYQ